MRNEVIVRKMTVYVSKVLGYCEGRTYDGFIADSKLVEACVFNLSQLGELCRIADEDYKAAHPELPWHEMYGLRNRIFHDFYGFNLRLVGDIIRADLPVFKKVLDKLQ